MAAALTLGIYFGVSTRAPKKKAEAEKPTMPAGAAQMPGPSLSIDTFLVLAKKQLTAAQVARLTSLENSVTRGAVKDQQLHVYHELARFYYDTANAFEPYAWYTAEAARLENSEKSLTFAARLFLERVMSDVDEGRRHWMASQAQDLFQRSLTINPGNDSAQVGLGAVNLFGGVSSNPMVEGMQRIKSVADKDSTNTYAQMMLVQGALMTGQYDKAISRLQTVARLEPNNAEPLVLLADVYERTGKKKEAIQYYQQSLPLVDNEPVKAEIRKRIDELKK